MNDKKGEVYDILIWLITIFVFAIVLFIFVFIIPNITTGLRSAGLNNTPEGISAINHLETNVTGTINYGFMMLFIGLIIGVFISSFLVRTHPIFLFMYIFFLAITILVSFYLGNAYDSMIANPIFSNMLSQANFITLVMEHIAEISVGVGVVSMIIVFAKFSTFGGSQQY
jgi:hypothetical protein